jgi:putative hydrolase of the HAD superfamily
VTIRAVLFDLDDTLVPELPAWDLAFAGACSDCAAGHNLDPLEIRKTVFRVTRELWQGSPVFEWTRGAGIAFFCALVSEFAGDAPEYGYLRGWTPLWRSTAWRAGLAEAGIKDAMLAEALAAALATRFAQAHVLFDDVIPALDALASRQLAVVTNGPADLQRRKLAVAGLEARLPSVFISGEVGYGKPDPRIFEHALAKLGIEPHEALMVGDRVNLDVAGALAAGVHAAWLNRDGARKNETEVPVDYEIKGLGELAALLEAL